MKPRFVSRVAPLFLRFLTVDDVVVVVVGEEETKGGKKSSTETTSRRGDLRRAISIVICSIGEPDGRVRSSVARRGESIVHAAP